MAQQVFKNYNQNQMMLLPPSLDELIPEGHVVRFINKAVDSIDTTDLVDSYQGGGTSAYHPVMLLKVLVYAYTKKIFTVRPMAAALCEDIHFMWLSGMNRPDFRTINNFRSGRLKPHIERIFSSLLETLIEQGYINLKNYFVDGSKWEANANPHSHVWAKNTERYKAKTRERIEKLLKEIDALNEEENQYYGDNDLEEKGEGKDLNSKDVEQELEALKNKVAQQKKQQENNHQENNQQDKSFSAKKARKNIKKAETRIGWIEKRELKKLKKYETQEQILQGRNSYSKTDTDAVFMRMKDDRLRAGYNVLLGSESLFVVNYSLHQNPGESGLFTDHMRKLRLALGRLPENIVGDSAYGSLTNYTYLAQYQIGNYLKFNTFHKEKTRRYKNNPYLRDNMAYDAEKDEFTCEQGRKLRYKETETRKNINGQEITYRVYECEDCSECPVASACKKSSHSNRSVRINWQLESYKQQARDNLHSPTGKALRKQRNYDVEAVFGQLKHNMGHRRFYLRGYEKASLEFGLLCFAFNIKLWFERMKAHPNQTANQQAESFFPVSFMQSYKLIA
ncbi:MAG: IS1182 family transposase [Bacteroidales bacterium]|nr:IS1182 family transposase [Bacteroidales bacterium]